MFPVVGEYCIYIKSSIKPFVPQADKLPQVMSLESASGSEDYKFENEENLLVWDL